MLELASLKPVEVLIEAGPTSMWAVNVVLDFLFLLGRDVWTLLDQLLDFYVFALGNDFGRIARIHV